MAVFRMDLRETALMECKCGHAWRSGVALLEIKAARPRYGLTPSRIEIAGELDVDEPFCSRCGLRFEAADVGFPAPKAPALGEVTEASAAA